MSYIVVIPARYKSSRLLGKPLVPLCGVPMIVRTYRQCIKAVSAQKVYVATDDERINQLCLDMGIQVVMTPDTCLTGTDRVAAVAKNIIVDSYINVQGDEPLFNPDDLINLIAEAKNKPHEIINGYCEILEEDMFSNSSTPKVVIRGDGRLLYMSRAAIPTNKLQGFVSAKRQVCAYAFPRAALQVFSEVNAKTPLEAIEDIEILRFLELGWEVRMIPMSDNSVAVDNPEDILRAEEKILAMGLT